MEPVLVSHLEEILATGGVLAGASRIVALLSIRVVTGALRAAQAPPSEPFRDV